MEHNIASLLRRLRNHLVREGILYRRYIELLKEQRQSIKSFQIDRINDITEKREDITRELQESHAERLLLIQNFPSGDGRRITDLIVAFAHGEQKKELLGPRFGNGIESSRSVRDEHDSWIYLTSLAGNAVSLQKLYSPWRNTRTIHSTHVSQGNSPERSLSLLFSLGILIATPSMSALCAPCFGNICPAPFGRYMHGQLRFQDSR
jgi:hypothetical protein